MKNKLRNKKGITLIALVITIIVLLILAGVSITMISSQDGILNKATSAKETQKKVSEEEAVKIALQAAMMNEDAEIKYDEIGNYLPGATGDKEAKVIKYNGRNYLISDDGTSKQVTWYVTINPEGRYVVTNGKKETEKVEIPLGTTINYDPFTGVENEKLTVTTETGKTGQTTAQTYTIANNEAQKLTWQVLGTDDDGNILIMPTTNVTDSTGAIQYMTIGGSDTTTGQNAAQYAAGEVNRVCSIYGHGKGAKSARSVQVEDIDKLTGFDKTKYAQNQVYGYGHDVTYSINETDEDVYYKWTGITEPQKTSYKKFTYLKGNEWISLEKGQSATVKNTNYYYDMSSDPYKTTLKNKGVNDLITKDTGNKQKQYYWLGSSYVHAGSDFVRFGLRFVGNSCVDYSFFFLSYGDCNNDYSGLRPAVSLESDVNLSDNGDGTWNIN